MATDPDVDAAPSTESGPSARGAAKEPNSAASATATPAVARATPSTAPPEVTEHSVRVPRDVQEAVAAVTGHRPAEVTVRRGPLINRTAARIAADSYATEGVVHLPGTAPLTTDRSRRLLAHELTHVVQQKSGTAPHHEATPAGRDAEQQAMRAEAAFAAPPSPATPSARASAALSGPSPSPTASVATVRNGRPAVARSTSAAAADRASTLPRTTAQRPAPRSFAPLRLNDPASATASDHHEAAPAGPGVAPGAPALRDGIPGSTPARLSTGSSAPAPTDPEQASAQRPPAAPTTLPSPTAPDSAPTQRRASHRGEPPGPGGGQGRSNGSAPTPANASSSRGAILPEPAIDTATDDVWLQKHAHALFPHLRQMLRNELLLDRERRGRLMRDD